MADGKISLNVLKNKNSPCVLLCLEYNISSAKKSCPGHVKDYDLHRLRQSLSKVLVIFQCIRTLRCVGLTGDDAFSALAQPWGSI